MDGTITQIIQQFRVSTSVDFTGIDTNDGTTFSGFATYGSSNELYLDKMQMYLNGNSDGNAI